MSRTRIVLALVALAAVLVGVVALVLGGGDGGAHATVGGGGARAEEGGGTAANVEPGGGTGRVGTGGTGDARRRVDAGSTAAREGDGARSVGTERATREDSLRIVVDVVDDRGPVARADIIAGAYNFELPQHAMDVPVDAGTDAIVFGRTDARGRATLDVPREAVSIRMSIDHVDHARRVLTARVDAFPLVVELESLWFLGGRVLEIGEQHTDWRVAIAVPFERAFEATRDASVVRGPDGGQELRTQRTDGRGSFTFALRDRAPCRLLLWARDAERVLAELGPFEPSRRAVERHPELDPLELARVVRLATVALVPPHLETDEQPDTRVWIEADDGTVWWRSAGWTAGPWVANLALPIDWDEPVTVRSDAYRPERLARLGERARVDLVRGPRVEVTVLERAELPEGARWLFGYRTASSSARLFPDDDGRAVWHVAEPGPVTIEATLDLPPLPDDEARDPRWDALAGARLAIADLEVPPAGLVTTVTVPDLDGLGALAGDAADER